MPTQTRNPKKNKKRHHPPPKPPKQPKADKAATPDLRSIQSMLGPDVMQQLQRTLQQAATSAAGVSRRQQATATASAASAAADAAGEGAPATAAAPAEGDESHTSQTVLRKFCPPSHLPTLS